MEVEIYYCEWPFFGLVITILSSAPISSKCIQMFSEYEEVQWFPQKIITI